MTASTYNFLIRLHVLLVVLLFLCCLTLARPFNSSGSDGRPTGGNMASKNSNTKGISGTEWSIKEGKVNGDGRILESSVMDYDYGEANQRHDPTKGNNKWGGGGGRRPPVKAGREP